LTKPKWKEFEKSVAKFVQALDPTAKVKHDVKLQDVHTNTPRQRDVWVEAKVCNHFPVKILVSCKRYKRKINQQDIDAFNGELISSGAQLGVIYSYSGFGSKAIDKAINLGVSCCKLYENKPADIPKSLIFVSSYCCSPRVSLSVLTPLTQRQMIKTWNDLFSLEFDDQGSSLSVIDAIVRSYRKGEKESLEQVKSAFFPSNWGRVLECTDEKQVTKSLKILIQGYWSIYEGRMEAHLLRGSYNFTNNQFMGDLSTPVIDTYSSHPGPGWTLLDSIPPESNLKPLRSIFIKTGGDVRSVLLEKLGSKKISTMQIEE